MFKTVNDGKMPTKGSKYSACVDLYANEDVVIGAGETKIVPLGVKIDLDLLKKLFISNLLSNDATVSIDQIDDKFYSFMRSHKLDLHIRSSLSAKKGLIIANGTGQIDLDYPDEIGIILYNPLKIELDCKLSDGTLCDLIDTNSYMIKKGDRIAQITLVEHKSYLFGIESDEERTGGFGSTGER